MGPYREAIAAEILDAPTRDGLVRLEVAPRHILLEVGDALSMSVTEQYLTVVKGERGKKQKKRSIRLDGVRLVVARALPTEDVGVWYESEPGLVARLLGIRQVEMLDDQALAAWRSLDRLVERLRGALADHAGGVRRAIEVGNGADRVLVMDFGDRLVLHVRRLFRERPRRALEVHADGTVVFPGKGSRGERRIRCTSRFGVTAMGDFIRFANQDGDDLGSIAIPWIAREARDELVQLIGRRIHQDD